MSLRELPVCHVADRSPGTHQHEQLVMAQVALVLISVAASLCGIEVVLRFALPQVFDVHPRGMYIQEESVGYVLTPGFSGVLSRSEFNYSLSINQVSQRGADPR